MGNIVIAEITDERNMCHVDIQFSHYNFLCRIEVLLASKREGSWAALDSSH